MQLNPYLHFNNGCEAAFKFYEKCLGGKIEALLPYAGTPAESRVPAEWKNKIMHARLVADGAVLMGCDAPPEHHQKPQGISITLNVKEPQKAEQIFAALSEKAKVTMPIQKTFWSARFGMLVDQFGIPWMVNCEQAA
ncbi:MAG TPA: VOC family protein [Terriglobales bacterium]|nr:VOC family protein [Terriglobales bacterium]